MTKNWEALKRHRPGTILYHEWVERNVRFMIVRGPGACCAYLGIPIKHPAVNVNYDDLPEEIIVHGGFTFSSAGDEPPFEKGWWWYGWDYAHSGDYVFYYDSLPKRIRTGAAPYHRERKWTIYDIIVDSRPAFKPFVQWLKRVEREAKHGKRGHSNSDQGCTA